TRIPAARRHLHDGLGWIARAGGTREPGGTSVTTRTAVLLRRAEIRLATRPGALVAVGEVRRTSGRLAPRVERAAGPAGREQAESAQPEHEHRAHERPLRVEGRSSGYHTVGPTTRAMH